MKKKTIHTTVAAAAAGGDTKDTAISRLRHLLTFNVFISIFYAELG